MTFTYYSDEVGIPTSQKEIYHQVYSQSRDCTAHR